jgi:hypothetical protein
VFTRCHRRSLTGHSWAPFRQVTDLVTKRCGGKGLFGRPRPAATLAAKTWASAVGAGKRILPGLPGLTGEGHGGAGEETTWIGEGEHA